ncbi:MAG: hypothetical protein HUJ69_09940, partial [Lachnospiraceae bacterium]|nr:hypothetical protein [Lachnospiraceae bacterium]
MKKKIEIDTFLSFQFVSAPNFSPDGTKAAFILSQASDKENTYKSNIYLLDVATKEIRPMTSMGDASGYTWTPENTLLFQTKRTKEDKESQDAIFYELDPRGGEARKAFTLNIKAGGIRFITDDLLVVSAMENIGQPLKDRDYEIIDETPFWFNGRGFTHGLRSRLYTYNRKTGELNPITEPAFNAHVSDVKNGLILYQGAPWEKGKRYDSDGVYLYDAQTGETRCVLEPNVLQSYYSVMFWGDGSIMTLATAEDENPGMAYPNFYRMDKENGKLELFASWAQTIGTSVGTDARFGGGESERMLGDKWYFVSTQADTATIRS